MPSQRIEELSYAHSRERHSVHPEGPREVKDLESLVYGLINYLDEKARAERREDFKRTKQGD